MQGTGPHGLAWTELSRILILSAVPPPWVREYELAYPCTLRACGLAADSSRWAGKACVIGAAEDGKGVRTLDCKTIPLTPIQLSKATVCLGRRTPTSHAITLIDLVV